MLDLIYPNRFHNFITVILPLALAQVHIGEPLATLCRLRYPSLSGVEVGRFQSSTVKYDNRREFSLIVLGEWLYGALYYSHGVLPWTELALADKVIDAAATLHRRGLLQGDVVPLVRRLPAIGASELQAPAERGSGWLQLLNVVQCALYLQCYLHHSDEVPRWCALPKLFRRTIN